MRDLFERTLSVILVLTGVALATTFAHREFFGSATQQRGPNRASPPQYMADWKLAVREGIEIGDSDAPVKVIEFADFECPFCRAFHTRFRDAAKRYGNDVSLVFVHFPLPMHRFARPAARAVECAASQGRFAQFQDLLYDKQDSLGLKSWGSYATEAGVVDMAKFARCVADTTKLPRVEAGLALGTKWGVQATPTVIINGWRFFSPPADTTLAQAIEALRAGRQPFSATPQPDR